MENVKQPTAFETLEQDIKNHFAYAKYRMTIRGMKIGIVAKGTKILVKLYSEKDMRERELMKKEMKLLLMSLDAMNFIYNDV